MLKATPTPPSTILLSRVLLLTSEVPQFQLLKTKPFLFILHKLTRDNCIPATSKIATPINPLSLLPLLIITLPFAQLTFCAAEKDIHISSPKPASLDTFSPGSVSPLSGSSGPILLSPQSLPSIYSDFASCESQSPLPQLHEIVPSPRPTPTSARPFQPSPYLAIQHATARKRREKKHRVPSFNTSEEGTYSQRSESEASNCSERSTRIKKLHTAIVADDGAIIATLCPSEIGLDIDYLSPLTEKYTTPLTEATRLEAHKAIQALCDAKADPEHPDCNRHTPLQIACMIGNHDSVQLLCKNGARPDNPCHYLSINHHRTSLLAGVAEHEQCEVAAALCNGKADPNRADTITGATPLTIACEKNNDTLIALLLMAKASPHVPNQVNGNTPLMLASQAGNTPMVQRLIDCKADLDLDTQNRKGETALLLAAENEKEDSALYLINAHANPNIQAWNNKTPLMAAAYIGHQKLVAHLLAREVNRSMVYDETGGTALDFAQEALEQAYEEASSADHILNLKKIITLLSQEQEESAK